MGVRPDYVIEIRDDVLREVDGPMLVHGLQGWNGKALRVPRQAALRPDPIVSRNATTRSEPRCDSAHGPLTSRLRLRSQRQRR
jgi:hypothetical protein